MIPMRAWIISVLVAAILLTTGFKARSAELPKLPMGISCDQVRDKVAEHGKIFAYAWAKLNGYSREQINEAKKCLR